MRRDLLRGISGWECAQLSPLVSDSALQIFTFYWRISPKKKQETKFLRSKFPLITAITLHHRFSFIAVIKLDHSLSLNTVIILDYSLSLITVITLDHSLSLITVITLDYILFSITVITIDLSLSLIIVNTLDFSLSKRCTAATVHMYSIHGFGLASPLAPTRWKVSQGTCKKI